MITLLVGKIVEKETLVAFQSRGRGHALVHCLTVLWDQFNSMHCIRDSYNSSLSMQAVTILVVSVCTFHGPHHEFRTVFRTGNEAEILNIEKRVREE